MPYVRTRGHQVAIVHGVRDPQSSKVDQQILFTLYSRAEAKAAIGKGPGGDPHFFQSLLQNQHPGIKFNWKAISKGIEANLDVLPEEYRFANERVLSRFRRDLVAFSRQLILADPQDLMPAANLIKEHRIELEYLADLIRWRIKLCDQKASRWNQDNPFYWRFTMRGSDVPPDTEEEVAGFYEKGDMERAEKIFQLLTEGFDGYAEGYNYLGLVALDQEQHDKAIAHFQTTMKLGRRLFPKRIARSSWWRDLRTRPYIRGMRNLTLTLVEARKFDEALAWCERLEKECQDDFSAAAHRASAHLNKGSWKEALENALYLHELQASESFIVGFASFELGRLEESLAYLLHSVLTHPRAARLLVQVRERAPRNHDEEEDDNVGVRLLRALPAYIGARRGRGSLRLVRKLVQDSRVQQLLAELEDATSRWRSKSHEASRPGFQRMTELKSLHFAKATAARLSDLLPRTLRLAVIDAGLSVPTNGVAH